MWAVKMTYPMVKIGVNHGKDLLYEFDDPGENPNLLYIRDHRFRHGNYSPALTNI